MYLLAEYASCCSEIIALAIQLHVRETKDNHSWQAWLWQNELTTTGKRCFRYTRNKVPSSKSTCLTILLGNASNILTFGLPVIIVKNMFPSTIFISTTKDYFYHTVPETQNRKTGSSQLKSRALAHRQCIYPGKYLFLRPGN